MQYNLQVNMLVCEGVNKWKLNERKTYNTLLLGGKEGDATSITTMYQLTLPIITIWKAIATNIILP